MTQFRVANRADAPTLSELAVRSKASWGYSPEFMAIFADELKISVSDCAAGLVRVVEDEKLILGFYKLTNNKPVGELDSLFVEPGYTNRRIGSSLFERAVSHAKRLGITELEIVSDPHALRFYDKMGAELIDFSESPSIKGRWLPILRVKTAEPPKSI
jgi:N-acetylglutamate synthase-like GNAT family acetyltransferase